MTSVTVSINQPPPQTSWGHTPRWQQAWWRGFRCVQSPYLLCTRSLSGLIFALNWWDIIDDHIMLGGALMLDDIERLRQQGVGAVVNLCAERPDNPQRLQAAHMDYLWLPVLLPSHKFLPGLYGLNNVCNRASRCTSTAPLVLAAQ
jgi:hypothetical protein